ncbi:hypothetical protein R3I94_022720 [Phoxinus phoxinus]
MGIKKLDKNRWTPTRPPPELQTKGVEMSVLASLTQVSILAIFLFQCATSLPVLGRYLGEEDSISSADIFSPRKVLFPRDDADMFVALQGGRSGLQTRQLGDIEFTNRYAELLKSKAKITSICAFLKRMENSKKSGGGDSDRLIFLMRQYSCPNLYQ